MSFPLGFYVIKLKFVPKKINYINYESNFKSKHFSC